MITTTERTILEGNHHGAVESDFHALMAAPYVDYQARWATEPNVLVSTWIGLFDWQRTGFVHPKHNWKGFPANPALWSVLLQYFRTSDDVIITAIGGTYTVPANSWLISMQWNGWGISAWFVKTGSKDPRGTYPKVVDNGTAFQFAGAVTEMTIEDVA